jgi:hypothetical protein
MLTAFGEPVLRHVSRAIAAYEGENARNSYDVLYPARAAAAAVLGSERIFGTGASRASRLAYAELLTETRYMDGSWPLGSPRLLDPAFPLFEIPADRPDLSDWLYSRSLRSAAAPDFVLTR